MELSLVLWKRCGQLSFGQLHRGAPPAPRRSTLLCPSFPRENLAAPWFLWRAPSIVNASTCCIRQLAMSAPVLPTCAASFSRTAFVEAKARKTKTKTMTETHRNVKKVTLETNWYSIGGGILTRGIRLPGQCGKWNHRLGGCWKPKTSVSMSDGVCVRPCGSHRGQASGTHTQVHTKKNKKNTNKR